MQRKTKGIRTMIALSLGMMILGSSSGYGDSTDYAIDITEKLGRGIGNLLGSPLEIPCAMRDDVSERGALGIVSGFFKGLALFLRRALVGADEAATFIIPMDATLPRLCAKKPTPTVETKSS